MSFQNFASVSEAVKSVDSSRSYFLDGLERLVSTIRSGGALGAQLPDNYARSYAQVQQTKYDADGNITDVTSVDRLSIPNAVIAKEKSKAKSWIGELQNAKDALNSTTVKLNNLNGTITETIVNFGTASLMASDPFWEVRLSTDAPCGVKPIDVIYGSMVLPTLFPRVFYLSRPFVSIMAASGAYVAFRVYEYNASGNLIDVGWIKFAIGQYRVQSGRYAYNVSGKAANGKAGIDYTVRVAANGDLSLTSASEIFGAFGLQMTSVINPNAVTPFPFDPQIFNTLVNKDANVPITILSNSGYIIERSSDMPSPMVLRTDDPRVTAYTTSADNQFQLEADITQTDLVDVIIQNSPDYKPVANSILGL